VLALPSIDDLEAARNAIRDYSGWLNVEDQLKGQEVDTNRKQLLDVAKDILPENLPEAWSGETTTALEISHALSTKVGKILCARQLTGRSARV
jgi:hypothetical protein